MKKLSLLGSTGSIGTQALDVVRCIQGEGEHAVQVAALAAHSNIRLLEEQIREFKPQAVAVFDLQAASALRAAVRDLDVKVYGGMEGLCALAELESADIVLNSVVGMVGLQPTLTALKAKKQVALANKETLVAGGALVMQTAKENGIEILPVDSEHSAIFQCLQGMHTKSDLNRIILTASGGPFFGKTRAELSGVKPADALKHPNWDMGAKVTIDSSTLMNKGLEFIEAKWLFDMEPDDIDVIVHRESIVHSLIEYRDHSVIAQLGVPDMRIPIQYALTYPRRFRSPVRQLNLADWQRLTFFAPDEETFSCFGACKRAIRRGGTLPAAVNGANEAAVALFLKEQIGYLDIGEAVCAVADTFPTGPVTSVEDVLAADRAARAYVTEKFSK
ncbi:MAG: 1-deoxy-D-xylulose-5-phosphate reductoisomerase [Ruminococcus bromii]|nr:1-deoxy-D-xylulose-5-phosphate reductoisomerase [Ruminococcus bromii]